MGQFPLNKRKQQRKNIIIIGAGIGGLCTGIRLQHAGFNVKIYEKNSWPGGCIRYVISEDEKFKIDESASLAINPLTYEKIFNDLGRNPREYFQWISLENYYKVLTYDNKEFYLCTNLVKTQEQLKGLYPNDLNGYTKFIFDTSYKYLMAKDNILNRPFIDKGDFYNFKTIKTLAKLKVLNNGENYLNGYIKSEELQQLILFQTFFMGVSPYEIPSIYTAVAANTQIEGMGHIKGGLSAYVLALEKLFFELGGKIQYNALIKNLIYNNKKVKGIIYEGEFIHSDKVVLNIDYINGQQNLLRRKIINSNKTSNLIKSRKEKVALSCSTFIIHLGLRKKFESLEVHNLYLNKNFKEEVERVFQGKLPETPSLYIYYPSVKDDSFCKDSRESVMNIMVRVPNLKELDTSWSESTKIKLYDCCIRILEGLLKVKDLRSDILYHSVTTPKDFQINYDYYEGSCFGIGHTFFQSMVFRPQIKDKKLKNLYYVGTSIHPGNGASVVMECAQIVSKEIINDEK